MKDFPDILQRLWWRLDRALLDVDVEYSALVSLVDAIKQGTTTLIDHHASPNAINNSLDQVADAVQRAGVRAALCYEVTDRNGRDGTQAGIDENIRYLYSLQERDSDLLAGTFGLHASLSVSDGTLADCIAAAKDLNTGFHIHAAEHEVDEYDSLYKYNKRVIHRLADAGILGPKSIVAHCVHIDPAEMELLLQTGTWVTHQPRSNMNNAVGYSRPQRFGRETNGGDGGNRVGLGTDGIGADMLEEFRVAFVRAREADVTTTPDTVWAWLDTGYELFPEARDDRVTWTYEPMDPWRLAYSPGVSPVSVEVDGEIVYAEGAATRVDGSEIRAKAAEAAQRLFQRLENDKAGERQ